MLRKMKRPKLSVKIGIKKDKDGNPILDKDGKTIPIYKEVKKLKVMYIDENKVIAWYKVKPFWNGQYWMFKMRNNYHFINDPDSTVFPKPRLIGNDWCSITSHCSIPVEELLKPKE